MSDRCLSSCEAVPGQLKRCQGDAGHDGEHRWIEAIRADGAHAEVFWSGSDACEPDRRVEIRP